jgi:hypothetical protein
MKFLGGLIAGGSVILYFAAWVVATDFRWLRSTSIWLMVLLVVGLGLFAYGVHLDRRNKRGP